MMTKHDQPLICELPALELATRKQHLLKMLYPHIQEIKPLPDGCAWRFEGSDDRWAQLADFVRQERQCCAFLRFQLIAEPQNGPLWLEATGPQGTRAFLETMFAP